MDAETSSPAAPVSAAAVPGDSAAVVTSVPPSPPARPRFRWRLWLGLALLVVLLGVGAGLAWRQQHKSAREERDFALAELRIREGKLVEARSIIALYLGATPPLAGDEERRVRWWRVEIDAAQRQGNLARLAQLYERVPALFVAQEAASLLLCQTMIAARDLDRHRELRARWHGRGTDALGWLNVDARAAMQAEGASAAMRVLQSKSFQGRAEADRLLHLAMIAGDRDPDAAVAYLNQAVRADARHPDVRLVRGRQYERAGELGLALQEFTSAYHADPGNPQRIDDLSAFYHRRGDYPAMQQILATTLREGWPEHLWLRSLIWHKLALRAPTIRVSPAPGALSGFLAYLRELPGGTFWDETAFLAKVPGGDAILRTHQEGHWLQLCQALREGRFDDALHRLEHSPFLRQSWYRDLENALSLLVQRRQRPGPVKLLHELSPAEREHPSRHLAFRDLDDLIAGKLDAGRSASVAALCTSPHGPGLLFLAGGWFEAGLSILGNDPVLEPELPEWAGFVLVQATRLARDPRVALALAGKQPSTPELRVLVGDLHVSLGEDAAAAPLFAAQATSPTITGVRAASLLAALHLRGKRADEAAAAVQGNPALRGITLGQELLAEAALLRGDAAAAEQLYRSIVAESGAATAYLARVMMQRRAYADAAPLIERLIRLEPQVQEWQTYRATLAAAAAP